MITPETITAVDRLLSLLLTRDDVMQFSRQLSEITNAVFTNKGDFDAIASQFLSREKKEILLELFESEGFAPSDPSRSQQYLVSLREGIETLPVLELQVAVEPSDNLVSQIADWVSQNMNGKVILDFHVKPDIIGGAIISWKGMIRQNTVSHLLKEEELRSRVTPTQSVAATAQSATPLALSLDEKQLPARPVS